MTNTEHTPTTLTITDVMALHPRNSGLSVCHLFDLIAGPGAEVITAAQYDEMAPRLRAVEL